MALNSVLLAGPVRSYNSHQGACLHVEGDVTQCHVVTKLDGYTLKRHGRAMWACGRTHLRASTMRSTFVLTMPRYVSPLLPGSPMEPE